MTDNGNIVFAGGTDTGLIRDHNEDSILCCEFPHSDVSLLVVADGVGGHEGGEVASHLAVDTMQEVVSKAVLQANSGGGYADNWLTHTLQQAIQEANSTILQQQQARPQYHNMASTVVAILVKRQQLAISHLGDSRCYRLNDGALQQITQDHTVLQKMLQEGKINQQEFEASPMHNLISQALGLEESPEIEVTQHTLQQHTYLLCSDGLSNCASAEEIAAILAMDIPLNECVDQLITVANDNGGIDNISVVLLRERFEAKENTNERK